MVMRYFLLFFFSSLFGEMTLQDKVGQVFLAPLYERELTEHGREFLNQTRLGNVIYFGFANGPFTKDQLAKLSEDLKAAISENCGIPPLLAIDQEGRGFNQYPDLLEVGRLLASVGVTTDLAPVVDVVVRPDCPLRYRSFGGDPDLVIEGARQMIRGLHESGIHAVLKHFPGLGDTQVDSHIGLPVLHKSLEELEALELKPYYALREEADAVMVAHVLCPAIDPSRPASLSPLLVQGLLRETIGFDKVIMTDSLVMKGVLGDVDSFEAAVDRLIKAAVEAFLAGSDLLILAKLEWVNFPVAKEQNEAVIAQVMAGFLKAVEEGEITEERLDASVRRILRMKQPR